MPAGAAPEDEIASATLETSSFVVDLSRKTAIFVSRTFGYGRRIGLKQDFVLGLRVPEQREWGTIMASVVVAERQHNKTCRRGRGLIG